MKKKYSPAVILLCIILCVQLFTGCSGVDTPEIDLSNIPEFSNSPYVEINNNRPYFTDGDYSTESFEKYSRLDSLGRCGAAFACIGTDLMPTEKRGYIGNVKPTGWQISKYDFVDGKYLYNRCHLIGYQLTAENANERNLITGTRYMNIEGMLPFENLVADYIKETDNHVLYRVTPVFDGDNLLAKGVLMEGKSVEDKGQGISFNVFCYNSQPKVSINYADGSNSLEDNPIVEKNTENITESTLQSNNSGQKKDCRYILNTNSRKIHLESCPYAKSISKENKKLYTGKVQELLDDGYVYCKFCGK